MKITQFIVFLFLLMVVEKTQAHREKSYLFAGVIGVDSALVEIIGHEEVWSIRYFTYSDIKETYIPGAYTNQMYRFEDENNLIKINKESWELGWEKNGKKLKHKLNLLDTTNSKSVLYINKRLSLLEFKYTVQGDKWSVMEETHSGLVFFRLNNPPNDSINVELLRLHSAYALHKIDTEADTLSFKLTHLSEFLSFKIEYGSESEIYNYNLSTCLPLHLEDVLYFGVGKVPDYQSKEWFDYRYTLFPSKLIPFLKVEDTCLDRDDLWQFPSWYLEEDNLVLVPFSPFGVEKCNLVSKKIALEQISSIN